MFLSPNANSNRVPAGQLLQGFWEKLAEDDIAIRIGPGHGFLITHRQPRVKPFTGPGARQFGLDALFGGQYPHGGFKSGHGYRKGGK